MTRRILQICPHDSAPFDALCRRYVAAGAAAGAEVVSIFLAPPSGEPLAFARYLDAADLSDTRFLRAALSASAAGRWDLVICHRYRAYWSVARSSLARFPCIVLAHEFGLLDKWQRRLNRRLFARHFRFAGVSAPVARELAEVTGSNLVMPNVMDVEQARQSLLPRQQARDALGLTQHSYVVGVVGRLHYKKRPAAAYAAFRLLQADCPGAQLVYLGDGDERGLGEGDPNVHRLGFVADGARYMPAFDVLLHTARAEPFGMVVLEAMVAGVPVVTLPHAGPRYALDELGVYALQDTPQGFAAALNRARDLDLEAYRVQALARVESRFSIPVLAQVLQGLLHADDRSRQTPSG